MSYQSYNQPYNQPARRGSTGKGVAIGCGIAALILFVIPLIIFLIIMMVAVGEDESGGDADNTADSGLTFPGKQPDDVAVAAGSTVKVEGVTITATTMGTKKDDFDKPLICSHVTVNNTSEEAVTFNEIDWSMQQPDGVIQGWALALTDGTLSAGELAPGGKKSGDVCFNDDSATKSGQYVLLYEPSFWSADRYAWVAQR